MTIRVNEVYVDIELYNEEINPDRFQLNFRFNTEPYTQDEIEQIEIYIKQNFTKLKKFYEEWVANI